MTALVKENPIESHFLLFFGSIPSTHAHDLVDELPCIPCEFVLSEQLDAITLSVREKIFVKKQVLHVLI